ncbi:RDD family protein [Blastopirellula sp. JC732]|uniref:RDD family protein n=1 Tax=Blastopirellula sediminis TaxID=2894196 RepID=A0A9X1SIL9_9BACT|nr:RDD family protein [Blastopirellula sediminis]MCC9609039.1 RDD family protein [Blastopirellula sediminis]MCC9628184.1 RDD family protein [Blastopirellula sediminis]
MSSTENPFLSPSTEAAVLVEPVREVVGAPQGRRLANLIVDIICINVIVQICAFILGICVGIYAVVSQNEKILEIFDSPLMFFFGLFINFSYYFLMEGLFGRTLGKLASGTKVVNEQGFPPSWGQVLGRTACRFIPFEPFSFFGDAPPRGWHDKIPKTYVVMAKS